MTLLHPSYLWGLFGILIPIAIHLWSKKKVRTIKVGSVKFIEEAVSVQHKSIAINEWWLLLLRSLTILFLVLILCEPSLDNPPQKTEITYIIEPSLLDITSVRNMVDTIPEKSIRVLTIGFPQFDIENIPNISGKTPKYWQLAAEMSSLETDSIIVFSKNLISGLYGKRPEIAPTINWISLQEDIPSSQIIKAIKKGDSIITFKVESDENEYAFAKAVSHQSTLLSNLNETKDSLSISQKGSPQWIPLENQKSIEISIYYDDSLSQNVPLFKTTLNAIARFIETPITITENKITDAISEKAIDRLIWLSSITPTIESERSLIYKEDSLADRIISPGNTNTSYHLTTPLSYEMLYEQQFAQELLAWLSIYPEMSKTSQELDRRVIGMKQFITSEKAIETEDSKETKRSVSAYFWILLLITIVAERTMAYVRKQ